MLKLKLIYKREEVLSKITKFVVFCRKVVVKLTRLTTQIKSDSLEVRLRTGLQQVKSSTRIDRSQTCFAGKGTLTKQELATDLKYAESVRRQKFW